MAEAVSMFARQPEPVTNEVRRAIHAALSAISARCDGAHQLDGQGFSGTDASFGNLLAKLPPETLTPENTVTAYEMLRKYRGQLADCGIDYDSLPKPEGSGGRRSMKSVRTIERTSKEFVVRFGYDPDLVAALKAAFDRRQWKGEDRSWRIPLDQHESIASFARLHDFTLSDGAREVLEGRVQVARTVRGSIDVEDGEFVLRWEFDKGLTADVKVFFPTRRWDNEAKCWRVPVHLVRLVRQFAEKHSLTVTPAALDVPDADPERTPLSITQDGDSLVLRFDFVPALVEAVGRVAGARWDPKGKAWRVPVERIGELIRIVKGCALDIGGGAADLIAAAEALEQRVEASWALDAELEMPADFGYELIGFQRGGVAYALGARLPSGKWGCLIGDDMGLGKTIQLLAIAAVLKLFPIVVVCPKKPKRGWLRMTRRALPGVQIATPTGTRAPKTFGLMRPDVVIVHYDILEYWMPAIRELGAALVFVDEVHKCKNPTAARTATVLDLAAVATEGVFASSGTLVPNRRSELIEPLRIIGWLDELGGREVVLRRPDLADALRARCMVRRTKAGVMPELPPREYQRIEVPGDPLVMPQYDRAEVAFLEWLKEWALAQAAELGIEDLTGYALEKVIRARSAQALVQLGHLRRLAGQAKVCHAIEHANRMVEEGKSLLVFAEHVRKPPVLRDIAKALGAPRIDGDTNEDAAMHVEDRFQAREMPVVCLSRAAAGEGLTLTAASDALFVELPWGPGALDQALDRCYGRVNDPHGATGYELVLVRSGNRVTVDARMLELIEEKREESHDALDAAYDDEAEDDLEDGGGEKAKTTILGDLVWSLTEEVLSE